MTAAARTFTDLIDQARAVRVEDEIARRGIKLRGNVDRCGPCPVCGGRDRFAINVRKQCFICRGSAAGDVIAMVEHLDGCNFVAAVETLTGEDRPVGGARPAPAPAKPKSDSPWRHIWGEARAPAGTPVELHLARRHLSLPDSEDIRFHPGCPFGSDSVGHSIYVPAMVALVRHIITNKPQGVHRTALDLQGNQRRDLGKNGRLSLGAMIDGAIKLTPDEHVTIALGIAEGIETALSLQRLPEWFGSPVWSLLYADNLANLPVLPGIETLAVAVDRDKAGEDAAREVSQRWRAAGRTVFLARADVDGEDINDVMVREDAL
jgi:hypothetical protein